MQRSRNLSLERVRLLREGRASRGSIRRRVGSAQLRQGIYILPSLFTAGNLFCGFFSLVATFKGNYHQAAILIVAAHLLDGLDGFVARLTKTSSRFGIELDSLADLVSFGVAPSMLVYIWALVPWGTWGKLAACLFVVCGALRLARFNVQTAVQEKKYFTGLPIPAAAQMIAAFVFLYYFFGGEAAANKQVILLVVIYVLAGLMVSNFRYHSLKQHHFKKRGTIWILLSALGILILTIAMWQIMLFTALLLYTLSGPLLCLFDIQKGRREKKRQVAQA